jgi:hypothetical protein
VAAAGAAQQVPKTTSSRSKLNVTNVITIQTDKKRRAMKQQFSRTPSALLDGQTTADY